MIIHYTDYLNRLSEEFQKPINPLTIVGLNILIDPHEYLNFTKTLGHVFRNIIDHGIESVVEREQKGKEEKAKITCAIKKKKDIISQSLRQ